MNSNFFESFSYEYSSSSTPPKKTSTHHCNADKKNNPFRSYHQDELNPIRRNLFGEASTGSCYTGGSTMTTKLLRWDDIYAVWVVYESGEYHWDLSLEMMSSSFLVMNWLSMMMASLRASW